MTLSNLTPNLFSNPDGSLPPAVMQNESPDGNLDENGQDDQDDLASNVEPDTSTLAMSTRASAKLKQQTKAELKQKAVTFVAKKADGATEAVRKKMFKKLSAWIGC